jgi:choline dehydrogenase-like flavoprotein
MSPEYDVIVIGSGFGGSVTALRLSEKGYRVGVLEQGARWRPEDYPPDSVPIRKTLWQPRFGQIAPAASSARAAETGVRTMPRTSSNETTCTSRKRRARRFTR